MNVTTRRFTIQTNQTKMQRENLNALAIDKNKYCT